MNFPKKKGGGSSESPLPMTHILLDPRIYSCLSQNSDIKYFNYVNKIYLNENSTQHYTALFHYTYAKLFPFIRRRY